MVTFFGFDGGNELASSAFCSNSPILSTAYKIIAHQMKSHHLILQTLIAHLIYRLIQAKSGVPDCNNKPQWKKICFSLIRNSKNKSIMGTSNCTTCGFAISP